MVNVNRVIVEEEHRITAPTDEALVASTIAGEAAAFAELFRRHKRMTARIDGTKHRGEPAATLFQPPADFTPGGSTFGGKRGRQKHFDEHE